MAASTSVSRATDEELAGASSLRHRAAVLIEGVRVARSQPGLSVLLAVISLAVCLLTLGTTGQSISAERAVLARIDEGGTRTITVVDRTGSANISTAAVDRIAALSGVRWALGIGRTIDAHTVTVPNGPPVPARPVYGSSPALRSPQDAQPRGALVSPVSQQSLGLDAATGALRTSDGQTYPVVGIFEASGVVGDLGDGVVLVDPDYVGPLSSIVIEAGDPADVSNVADAARSLTAPDDASAIAVEVSEHLARARAAVQGEVGSFGRVVVVQALAVGLLLSSATVYAGVTARRRDFGRRRALGATRPQLVALVLVQITIPAAIGASLGSLAGAAVVRWQTGGWPGWQFPLAIAVLTVGAAVLAAIVPACVAAFRDPVAVLRVP
ncbi:hypothetical protein HJG43_07510 [Kineosporiaceae bacterium SCSIO 59966]|nr:hypothetical protein HJG43_07510 [Kineosporiaceae bacterium SCSIO 59966]